MGRGLSDLQRTILDTIPDRPIFLHLVYFRVKKKYFGFETISEKAYRFKPNSNDRKVTVSICRAIGRLKQRGLIRVEQHRVEKI